MRRIIYYIISFIPAFTVLPEEMQGALFKKWLFPLGGTACTFAMAAKFSGAASCAPASSSHPVLKKMQVQPYGVLGTQLTAAGVKQRVPEPAPKVDVIVDPAGLHHIQGPFLFDLSSLDIFTKQKQLNHSPDISDSPASPRGAGGAAGIIYKWLQLDMDAPFPAEVRGKVQNECDAALFAYPGDRKVISTLRKLKNNCTLPRVSGARGCMLTIHVLRSFFARDCR